MWGFPLSFPFIHPKTTNQKATQKQQTKATQKQATQKMTDQPKNNKPKRTTPKNPLCTLEKRQSPSSVRQVTEAEKVLACDPDAVTRRAPRSPRSVFWGCVKGQKSSATRPISRFPFSKKLGMCHKKPTPPILRAPCFFWHPGYVSKGFKRKPPLVLLPGNARAPKGRGPSPGF